MFVSVMPHSDSESRNQFLPGSRHLILPPNPTSGPQLFLNKDSKGQTNLSNISKEVDMLQGSVRVIQRSQTGGPTNPAGSKANFIIKKLTTGVLV